MAKVSPRQSDFQPAPSCIVHRRHEMAPPRDARKAEYSCRLRSGAASLITQVQDLAPAFAGDVWVETVSFEARFAKPKGFLLLFVRHYLAQAPLDQRTQGRVLARRHLASFAQQGIGDFKRRFHGKAIS